MNHKTRSIPAVVAGAVGMSSGALAWAAEPTTDELRQQIEQLQAKVQQLEARQQEQESSSAAATDATVDRVLRDAERRSQLLQVEGFTAGWDNGFKIRSADGTFLLQPFFQFQFRNTTNFVDGRGVFDNGNITGFDDDNDVENGFEIRRMKLGVRGNAFTPDLTYEFRWATRSSGGDLRLENAFFQYQFAHDMAVRGGQWKDDWTHEESVSSSRQLAVDRSLLNELLGGGQTDYVQGIMVLMNDPDSDWRVNAAFHDGANSDNTDWVDRAWGFSGRVEYKFNGDWRAYNDFSARGNRDDLLVLGAGVDFTQSGSTDLWFHTVDIQWENTGGLGLYGAYVGQSFDSAGNDFYSWGFLAQAGYMLDDRWEVFGRYDYTKFDFDTVTGGDDFSEFTVGLNYYWYGHDAKFTVDVSWLPDGAPDDLRGIGVLASDDDQFIIRAQFQLLL